MARKIKAIILAAGRGTRLGNLTKNQPKCLVQVGGKTILERQINLLQSQGIKDITVVIGAKGSCWTQPAYETIKDMGLPIVVNFDNHLTHNVYSIYLAIKKEKPTHLLLLDGDLVYTKGLITRILSSKLLNFMVTKIAHSRAEAGTRITTDRQLRITDLGKSLIPPMFPWDIHSGIFKISQRSFPVFKKLLASKQFYAKEIEKPMKQFCAREPLYAFRSEKDEWVNINTTQDLKQAHSLRDL